MCKLIFWNCTPLQIKGNRNNIEIEYDLDCGIIQIPT